MFIEFQYLEIIEDKTLEVVSRMDVTNLSERQIEKVWDGASINLNHKSFSLKLNQSKTELPKI